MPELPEVEAAMEVLRQRAHGRTIVRVRLLHPALRRRVTPAKLRGLVGARVARVERRGKHQLMHLDDGRIIHVHFRMNGDWTHAPIEDPLPKFARAVIEFDDRTALILIDSRALGTLEIHKANEALDLGLGPDAADAAWTAEQLGSALAARRGPIKPALLDQRLVAGLGNIYAAESLWRAKIHPATRSDALAPAQVRALREAIAAVIVRATGSRYTDDDTVDLDVYDREGLPCRRCGTAIERIVQAGRSTYFCPFCQSSGAARPQRAARATAASRGPAKAPRTKQAVAKKRGTVAKRKA
ncbi:MAG: formamidopyrimidine-DNA glycosylase [Gemmatimonadetes bacterium]|jgi:formamidopyrimidine-DNA glycosylase|nr:formamidopyrimidine-DNA glycosylase [Gemmatimonadota bacterium]